MGLTAIEADLLQAVFRSEPAFRQYYKSPPLVAAMAAMGLLVPEDLVARRRGQYDYDAWRKPASAPEPAVRVAVLPSLIPGFRMAANGELAPPEDYVITVRALKMALQKAVTAKLGDPSLTKRLEIRLYQERPFVLHPMNAEQHLTHLCPDANLVLILLGRNVYRAMAFESTHAAGLRPPHWYLDILDLKYGQSEAEIDAIATAVVHRLEALGAPFDAGPPVFPRGPRPILYKASENTL
jgi:hypothetical protein